MSLAFLFPYLMLNMFRMLIHPSSGACDLFVELFHGLYCSGTMCVGVTVWFGWGGVVSLCRLKHCFTVTVTLRYCYFTFVHERIIFYRAFYKHKKAATPSKLNCSNSFVPD